METFAELIREGAAVVGIQAVRLWPDVIAAYWLSAIAPVLLTPVFIALLTAVAYKANAHVGEWGNGHDDPFKVIAVVGYVFAIGSSLIWLTQFGINLHIIFYPEAAYVARLIANGMN